MNALGSKLPVRTLNDGTEGIFLDNSTLFGAFAICKERARLSSVWHISPKERKAPLSFGTAIHAGIESLGRNNNLDEAKKAFLKSIKEQNANLPISIMDVEKHSLERGLALIEAYQERWQKEWYQTMPSPMEGKYYVEIKFRIHLFDYRGIPVFYCGIVDRLGRNTLTGQPAIIETKTTGQALVMHALQIKPNHQVTGYIAALRELGIAVNNCVWDAIYKSTRKPQANGDRFMMMGVDIEKDFMRTITSRSETEVNEYMFDLKATAVDYLDYCMSGRERWPRTGNPGACHVWGGCMYTKICSSNVDPNVLITDYEEREWKPWEEVPE